MHGETKERPTQNNWRQANVQKSQRQVNANNHPGCPKTPHEPKTLRTPKQGRNRVFDSSGRSLTFHKRLPCYVLMSIH